MRIGKNWLLALLPLPLLLAGCSDYDKLKDLSMDDVNPEFVVPVVHDTVRLRDLLERKDENTKVRYEPGDKGIAYVEYTDSREFSLGGGVLPNKDLQGEEATELSVGQDGKIGDASIYIPISLYNVDKFISGFTGNKVTSSGATLGATSMTVVGSQTTIKLKAESSDSSLKGHKLKGTIVGNTRHENFEVEVGKDVTISFDNYINDKPVSLTGPTNSKMDLLPFSLSNLELQGGTSGNIKLTADFLMKNVKYVDVKGKLDPPSGGLDVSRATKDIDFNTSLDVFKTSIASTLMLPKASVTVTLTKPSAIEGYVSAGSIEASYMQDGSKQTEALENMPGFDKNKSLAIIGEATAPDKSNASEFLSGDSICVYEWNADNSTIGDLFHHGVRSIDGKKLKAHLSFPVGKVVNMPVDTVCSLGVRVKIPFRGRIEINEMKSEMKLAKGVFPGEYLDYLKESKEQGADLRQPVKILFRFKNYIPSDFFASLRFLDDAKNEVLKLNLKSTNTSENYKKTMVLIRSSKVRYHASSDVGYSENEGEFDSSVLTTAEATISQEDYKKLSEKAKILEATYYVRSLGADQKKNVIIRRNISDFLVMNMALDVTATLHIGD